MTKNVNTLSRYRFISFFFCLLLMCATALCVNKTLFGHSFRQNETPTEAAKTDTVSYLPDGTMVIHTAALTKAAGYAGPVPLDIYLRNDSVIEIRALPYAETPGFFSRAEEIIPEWIGKTSDEAAELKVDAVSGATYSSQAIITNVKEALAHYDNISLNKHPSIPLKIWIAIIVTLCACILPLFIHNKAYRFVQQIANIVVLGFWCGQFLDYALMLRYLSEGFSLPTGIVAILMLIAAFIYPLFGKPQHYCNHICPLGAAQMLVAEICTYKIKISPKVIGYMDWFRRILWAALMLFLWADIWTEWMDLELFQAFMVESASTGIIIAAALFIALSAIVSRPYCRFVCPTGSLFKRSENIG